MYIYTIRRKETHHDYIGQTTVCPVEHWKLYKRMLVGGYFHNSHLQHAWNKYSVSAYVFEVIDETAKTQEQLDKLETHYISVRGYYNIKSGGATGMHGEETKKKISQNNARHWAGKKRPELSKLLNGHKVSKETRAKISKALSGRLLTEQTKQKMKGRVPWNKGKRGVQVAWNKGMIKREMEGYRK